jgi:hypothetical protein
LQWRAFHLYLFTGFRLFWEKRERKTEKVKKEKRGRKALVGECSLSRTAFDQTV